MNLSQNETKNIKSFFALRIYFIILILTILPLLIYSIFLYRAEYKQKKDDIYSSLTIFSSQLKENIEKNLDFKKKLLNSFAYEINFKNIDINEFFIQKVKEFDLQQILWIDLKNTDFVVKNSSKKSLIGKNVSFLKNILNERNKIFQNELLECKKCIFLSETIYLNKKPFAAIALSFLPSELFKSLPQKDIFSHAKISFVDPFGKVIFSNQKNSYSSAKNKNFIIKTRLDDYRYEIILSLDKKYLKQGIITSYIYKHTIILAIVFVCLIILSFIIIKILSGPTNHLFDIMQQIKNGKFEKRYKMHKMGFEINYLGTFFNEMMDSLIIQQKNIETEKLEKQKYIEQMQIAKDIQKSLLPHKPLKDIKNTDIAFGSIFAKEVGGDFFDFIIKDKKLFFVIADIASKGISACLYALNLRSIIRSYADYLNNLDEIVMETNKLFLKDAKPNSMFSTAWFGIYDFNSKNLKYANLGHMPAILRKKDGKIDFLTTNEKALGVADFEKIQINEISLEKGDLLFLYTDGIIDAIDEKGKFFGQKRLLEFIKNNQNLSSNEIVEKLFKNLQSFSKDSELYDDMAALTFKIF